MVRKQGINIKHNPKSVAWEFEIYIDKANWIKTYLGDLEMQKMKYILKEVKTANCIFSSTCLTHFYARYLGAIFLLF